MRDTNVDANGETDTIATSQRIRCILGESPDEGHHAVILAAMKAKQNADAKHATALEESIEALAPYYPEPKSD